MFKKIAIAVAAIAVGVSLIVGPVYVVSLVGSWISDARESFRDRVPPETEIARLKREVAKLDRDFDGHIDAIAKKKVVVQKLQGEIKDLQGNLSKQRERLAVLTDAVENDTRLVSENGTVFSKERITKDLDRSVRIYRTTERNLETKRDVLTQEEEALEAAKEQLRTAQMAKHELEVELARLEAELMKVKAAENKSKVAVPFNSSRLDRIKRDVERVREKVQFRQERLKAHEEFGSDPIPVEPKVNQEDVLKDAKDILNKKDNKIVHHD